MKNILCFGDSNTYGFNCENGGRFPSDERWCGVLQEILGKDYNVIEEGCNGRTVIFKDFVDCKTCGIDYLPFCLSQYENLDAVVILLGLNDFQKAFNATVDEVIDGIRVLTEIIKKTNSFIKILLLAPPVIQKGISKGNFGCLFGEDAVEKSKEYVKKLEIFAKENNCLFFNLNNIIKVGEKDCLHIEKESHYKLGQVLSSYLMQMV